MIISLIFVKNGNMLYNTFKLIDYIPGVLKKSIGVWFNIAEKLKQLSQQSKLHRIQKWIN